MVAGGRHPAAFTAALLGCLIAASCSSTVKKPEAPGSGAAGAERGALAVEISEWDFGSMKRGETAARTVALENRGPDRLEVKAQSTCSCLTARPESQTLGPGESGSLLLSFVGEDIKEKATKTIYVYYVEAGASDASEARITVTGRVEPGDGPHLQCLPAPLLFEKTGDAYGPVMLRVINRGRADLIVSEMRCFGCEAGRSEFTLGGNEEIDVAISVTAGWAGNRWLEVVSNDPVQATRKISLVVTE